MVSENLTHLFSSLKKVLVIRESTGFLYMGHSVSGEDGLWFNNLGSYFLKEIAVLRQ